VKRREAGCDVYVCECEVSGEILATELIRENIENLIRKKRILRLFGIFKGDHPSMAFHTVVLVVLAVVVDVVIVIVHSSNME
jgi:hypothetical protein